MKEDKDINVDTINDRNNDDNESRELIKDKKARIQNIIKIPVIPIVILMFIVIFSIFYFNRETDILVNVKSSLDKLVEKSDLETVTITYNVIAKKCKKSEPNCDKKSNNSGDFEYVLSCDGTLTAGINFKNVKIEVDKKKKKIIIIVPNASIISEPNVGNVKYLNGNKVKADEHPNAIKLCQKTIKEKSSADDKLIPAAKEQARVLLEEFYKKWIKAYDSSYTVEVR